MNSACRAPESSLGGNVEGGLAVRRIDKVYVASAKGTIAKVFITGPRDEKLWHFML